MRFLPVLPLYDLEGLRPELVTLIFSAGLVRFSGVEVIFFFFNLNIRFGLVD